MAVGELHDKSSSQYHGRRERLGEEGETVTAPGSYTHIEIRAARALIKGGITSTGEGITMLVEGLH